MTFKELKAAVKGRFMKWGKYTAEKLENVSGIFESTTTEDVGKVLTVGEDGSPEWGEAVNPLPPVTSGDNGDVLAVVNGDWSKAPAPSSLPPYTSADKGKVVAVVSNDVAIVPEQTVTIPVGATPPLATVSGANSEYFVVGQSAILTINGTPYPVTADLFNGLVEFHVVDPDETHYALLYLPSPLGGSQPGVYFQCSTYGEDFIISLTMPGDIGYGLKNIDNNLPDAPAGDGVYDLVVTDGIVTWVQRST